MAEKLTNKNSHVLTKIGLGSFMLGGLLCLSAHAYVLALEVSDLIPDGLVEKETKPFLVLAGAGVMLAAFSAIPFIIGDFLERKSNKGFTD